MILVVATGFFVVEFLQIPLHREKEINQYRVLIKQETLRDIVSLSLKNKVGSFQLEKMDAPNQWKVTSPRQLPATLTSVQSIFNLLENIRVLKLYDNEPINRSNFSLEKPYLSLELIDSQKQKYNIDFGLINPIDGTSYIYSSNTNQIYHIDAIDASLATLDLNSMVDGRAFIFPATSVANFAVYRISAGARKLIFSLQSNDKQWTDQQNNKLNSESVQEYLTEVSSIKSALILDSLEEETAKVINPQADNLQYEMVVKDIDENTYAFTISNPSSKSYNDYKIEKGKSLLIRPLNQKAIYVLNRDLSRLFSINLAAYKDLSFKKLFY